MIVDNKHLWYSQNRILRMKERKSELERFIQLHTNNLESVNNLKLFKKHKDQSYLGYAIELIILFILRLDMIVGFYINKYQMNRIFRKAKNEIKSLNLSIRIETKTLNERNKGGLYE